MGSLCRDETGDLLLTTIGARDRIKCTVIADVVNVAARIESLTKLYGAPLLIGERTYNALEDPEALKVRLIDRVAVKGKAHAIRLYEVLDAEVPARREAKLAAASTLLEGMNRYFDRDFVGAVPHLVAAKGLDAQDPVANIFLTRALGYVQSPPPEDWGGFEALTHK